MKRFLCLCFLIILTIIGLALLVTGGLLLGFGDKLWQNKIISNVPLTNGTKSFANWLNPGAPIYMSFYLFHIKNVDQIVKRGLRPSLEERGPYVYREIREKHDVQFLEDNTLLRYRQTTTFIFEPDLSVGPDSANFTGINLPLLGIASMEPLFSSYLWNTLIKNVFKGETLFSNFTVRDYLFGYTDPALFKLKTGIEDMGLDGNKVPTEFGIKAAESGNGTDGGFYTIKTGAGDINELNTVQKWGNMSELPWWGDDGCNTINGTDGTLYHPFVEKHEKLYVFASDICRSIYVTFAGEVINRNIPMYHFTPPLSVFAAPEINPDNAGYCVPADKCMKSGVLKIGPCQEGKPIVMSQPHFLYGDPSYINAFEGLNPNVKDHLTYLDIEPKTGVAMNVSKRLQINMMVGKRAILRRETRKLNETVWPLVWINENAVLEEETAQLFISKVVKPIIMLNYIKYVLLIVGLLIITICLFIFILMYYNRQEKSAKSDTEALPKLLPNGTHDHKPEEVMTENGSPDALKHSTTIETIIPLSPRNKEDSEVLIKDSKPEPNHYEEYS